ncbi:hypothetical protein TNCV_3233421 [Trichonephila clavipes]|nr:hypothetical protein TNCV_3233421 [Trichonephila clavipes]
MVDSDVTENIRHPPPPAKSGFGPQAQIRTWRQSGFGPPRIPASRNEEMYITPLMVEFSFYKVASASTPQFEGSNPGLNNVDSAFHSFSGSIKEHQACLGTKQWGVSRQTDYKTGTSAHASQRFTSRKLR